MCGVQVVTRSSSTVLLTFVITYLNHKLYVYNNKPPLVYHLARGEQVQLRIGRLVLGDLSRGHDLHGVLRYLSQVVSVLQSF